MAETFNRGGPLMWLLVPVSILTVAIVIDRLLYWLTLRLSSLRRRGLNERARTGRLGEPDRLLVSRVRDPLPYLLDRLFRAGHRGELVAAGLETEVARALTGVGLLYLLAEISTSVGLFGTVWGVIQLLPAYSSSDVAGVVSGLSTALYTTAGGLVLYLTITPIAAFLSFLAERMRMRLLTELQAAEPEGSRP